MTTRAEHLQWCKDRATEIIDNGDTTGGWTSFLSDLGKHPETAHHSAIMVGTMMVMGGHLKTPGEIKKFIQDFN